MSIPQFPTWPPPSGGAPVTQPEQGPIENPYPYGMEQGPNISTADPAPRNLATFFPKVMPPANGQNQPGGPLPPWPSARFNVLPTKADPFFSAIHPPPIMGPGPGLPPREGGVGSMSEPGRTFPAGSFLDGYGTEVTPTSVQTIGGGP